VFVLIDSRLDPQQIDLNFVTWLVECQVPFSLIFTKSDKSNPGRVRANRDLFLAALSEFVEGEVPTIIASSKTGEGRLDILRAIGELAQ
ncbi:MAG: YihA family ribosome biogenesis GTP-binding protein, partial [Verrucomicrobiota bacterium]